MYMTFALWVVLVGCLQFVVGDVYLHSPRGSNNRLDESNRDRKNDNRLFDSQNNDRGGVNVGSVGQPYYYADSITTVEWTNQHSCNDPRNNCEFIFQYMCDPRLRDGQTTTTIPATDAACADGSCDTDVQYGMHEHSLYYQRCKYRQRNRGLFIANQRLNGNAAIYTRQNPNGQRNGYECPEERDYYPYWHPSPWRDIFVLTNQIERCPAYQANSQNVKSRWFCKVTPEAIAGLLATNQNLQGFVPNNEADCLNPPTGMLAGLWTQVPAWNMNAPACMRTPHTLVNHLGNTADGFTPSYNWTVPSDMFDSLRNQNIPDLTDMLDRLAFPEAMADHCVVRLRYNISTSELKGGGWFSPSSISPSVDYTGNAERLSNGQVKQIKISELKESFSVGAITNPNANGNQDVASAMDLWTRYKLNRTDVAASFDELPGLASRDYVLRNNPRVDIFGPSLRDAATGFPLLTLQLNVNTNQFGRTFSDRSHSFAIRPSPPALKGIKVYNIGVRGKRGNIVQTYPGTEYDFTPNRLEVRVGDMVHLQWTGSNTSPAGGGNGPESTDRSNLVLLNNQVYSEGQNMTGALSSIGNSSQTIGQWGSNYIPLLSDPKSPFLGLSFIARRKLATFGLQSPFFDLGPQQVTRAGTYHYVCTRNNDFSNRSTKGKLVVTDTMPDPANPLQYIPVIYALKSVEPVLDQGDAWIEIEESLSPATGALLQLTTMTSPYGSDYAIVSPSGDLGVLPGKEVNLFLRTKSALPVFYKSAIYRRNMNFLFPEQMVTSGSGSVVSTSLSRGGVYVIETQLDAALIAGVVVAGLVAIAVAFTIYYRLRLAHDPTKCLGLKACLASVIACCCTAGGKSNGGGGAAEATPLLVVDGAKKNTAPMVSGEGGAAGGQATQQQLGGVGTSRNSKIQVAVPQRRGPGGGFMQMQPAKSAFKVSDPLYMAPVATPLLTTPRVLDPATAATPRTYFSVWGSNMAMETGLLLLLLGLASIFWFAQDSNKWGAIYILAGFYALLLGGGILYFERMHGHDKSPLKLLIRGLVYGASSSILYMAQATMIGAVFLTVTMCVFFMAAYHKEGKSSGVEGESAGMKIEGKEKKVQVVAETNKAPAAKVSVPTSLPSQNSGGSGGQSKASQAAHIGNSLFQKRNDPPAAPPLPPSTTSRGPNPPWQLKSLDNTAHNSISLPAPTNKDAVVASLFSPPAPALTSPPVVVKRASNEKGENGEAPRALSCCDWLQMKKNQNKMGTLIFLLVYFLANVVIFLYTVQVWFDKNNKAAIRERLSDWGPFAKGFGNVLNFNCSIIVLPVSRSVLRWLYDRSTVDRGCVARFLRTVLYVVPIDLNIVFHKLVALVVLACALGHVAFHLFNYASAPQPTLDKFGIWPWVSGAFIMLSMLFIYSAAPENVIRHQFEIFWYNHHFFVLFFFMLLLHGNGGIGPNFWKWFLLPGCIYVCERLLRVYRSSKEVTVLSVVYMQPNVLSLEFAKTGIFADGYKEGQYIFINCPRLSDMQWHPFTISSAPQETSVTVHIRIAEPGSWTDKLRDYFMAMGPEGASFFTLYRNEQAGVVSGKVLTIQGLPLLAVDGPHSAPTQHVSEYSTVMVIGGGIGCTPVASTLKSIVWHRWKKTMGTCFPSNAYFYWVIAHRDLDSFRWLIKIIMDAQEEVMHMRATSNIMQDKKFQVHIWVTGTPANGAVGTSKVPGGSDVEDAYGWWGVPQVDAASNSKYSSFSAMDLYRAMGSPRSAEARFENIFIRTGRPKWDTCFKQVSSDHPHGDIGVTFCGNPMIANDLAAACYFHSHDRKARPQKTASPPVARDSEQPASTKTAGIFKFHKENF